LLFIVVPLELLFCETGKMFRQEKDHLPFNEITHLTGESLRFCLNLRKEAEPVRQQKKAVEVPVRKMSELTPARGQQKPNDEFAVKETTCSNPQCLHNNLIYSSEFHEVVNVVLKFVFFF
jgi:hypothetical protein